MLSWNAELLGPRRRVQRTGGDLHVLLADRIDHVAGGERALGQLLRVQPHAHRVLAGTEDLHVADAIEPAQHILHVQARVVRQVQHVVALIGRGQMHDHGQVGRAFLGGHAEPLHFLGQLGQRLRHAILHVDLGGVEIGAERERHGQRQRAVAGGLRRGVQHAFDAVDLFLQRRGNGFGDDLGVGAGIGGAHHHGGRHHFGVFADRQLEHRQRAGDHEQQRQHRGHDRPVDKELGYVFHVCFAQPCGRFAAAAAASASSCFDGVRCSTSALSSASRR